MAQAQKSQVQTTARNLNGESAEAMRTATRGADTFGVLRSCLAACKRYPSSQQRAGGRSVGRLGARLLHDKACVVNAWCYFVVALGQLPPATIATVKCSYNKAVLWPASACFLAS